MGVRTGLIWLRTGTGGGHLCVERRGRRGPPQRSTHLVTNLDNTRHLGLRTKIPQRLTKLLFTFLQHEIPQAATTV